MNQTNQLPANDIYIGIDIGGTKVAFAVFDSRKTLLWKGKFMSDKNISADEFFSQTMREVLIVLKSHDYTHDRISGIGIGVPGMVDSLGSQIILVSMLPQLNGFSPKAYFNEHFPGVRVIIGNDSHAAALAEHRNGAGRGFSNMLFCPVSTGLASGIIIDGTLYRGSHGTAGESGHTIVTPGEGITCGCGNQGCLVSYSSGAMIVKHIQKWISDGEPTIMTELAGSPEAITAKHLLDAAQQKDRMAEKALDQMGLYLGIWVFNLYMTLDIECYVFGGGLINFGDLLFDRVQNTFYSYLKTNAQVHFKFAELGQDSGVIGALELLF